MHSTLSTLVELAGLANVRGKGAKLVLPAPLGLGGFAGLWLAWSSHEVEDAGV